MNTEERLKKLLAEVNAPQTVEERLDAIERTLAMAFEVQAAQQKLILMLCDRYGARGSDVDGSTKAIKELTKMVRFQKELIRERDAEIEDLEFEMRELNDTSGVSRVTGNVFLKAIFDQMLVHDFAQYFDTVSDWKAEKKDNVIRCYWTQRSKKAQVYSCSVGFNIDGSDAAKVTTIPKLINYWRDYFINTQIKIDAEADAKGGAK